MDIVQHRPGRFTARAVAADGFPHFLYRKKYWHVYASKPKNFDLAAAPGLNTVLRSRQLGEAHHVEAFPAPTISSSRVVGKWYCPFYLIKEDGAAPAEEMERSTFSAVSLEQRWESMHARDGSKLSSKKALISGSVEAKQESAAGSSRHVYVWFRATGAGQKIVVSKSVWERMLWEVRRGGWVDEEGDAGKVAGGLVLVERFVVKRLDGTVVVAFEFARVNSIRASAC